MKNDWILDVLSDLRTFAEANGFTRLAEEFDLTRRRAALELAALETGDRTEGAWPAGRFGPALDS